MVEPGLPPVVDGLLWGGGGLRGDPDPSQGPSPPPEAPPPNPNAPPPTPKGAGDEAERGLCLRWSLLVPTGVRCDPRWWGEGQKSRKDIAYVQMIHR